MWLVKILLSPDFSLPHPVFFPSPSPVSISVYNTLSPSVRSDLRAERVGDPHSRTPAVQRQHSPLTSRPQPVPRQRPTQVNAHSLHQPHQNTRIKFRKVLRKLQLNLDAGKRKGISPKPHSFTQLWATTMALWNWLLLLSLSTSTADCWVESAVCNSQ